MRLIGSFNHAKDADTFSQFLKRKGIIHQMDVHQNTDWGNPNYGMTESKLWITEEDQVTEALKWFKLFQNNPQDSIFRSSESPTPIAISEDFIKLDPVQIAKKKQTKGPAQSWDKQSLGWITRLLLLTCALLLIFSELLTPKISSQLNTNFLTIYTSPIDKALIYDYPARYELIDRFIQLYGTDEVKVNREIPAEGKVLLQKIKETPVWQGIYPVLQGGEDQTLESKLKDTPLFEKIRQGQVWRLFTPALLHADIFHLFFNMLWLIVLGKQIEQHLSAARYILFLLIVGIFSNTMQYLTSGPNFIGFSGILCGMLTFIWARQSTAPWEGYQLNRMTYLFMMVFIVGMAFLQLLSFFLEKSFGVNFSLNIANTAHLSGALIGYPLGKINTFSWRHS
jgi:GlpG protein